MPVEFLTEAQAQQYGRYTGEPDAAQLARYFYLDNADRDLLAQRRGDHNRLGYALQLGTVRFLGTFLPDPTDVPSGVVAYVAAQLGITGLSCLRAYRDRKAHWEHSSEIKRHYGYRDFTDQPEHYRLVRWLYTRAWLAAERPSVLFDLTTARLLERKILLPGVSRLTRLIAQVRERVADRLWHRLAETPNAEQRQRLESLLLVPEGARSSPLEQLRRAPTYLSAPGLVGALERIETIRALGVGTLLLEKVPPGRLKNLARNAAAARIQAISRMPEERRVATLFAFARHFEAVAQDDALDMLDQLIDLALLRAKKKGQRERLRTLKDLDAAAMSLREVGAIVLDEDGYSDPGVRAAVFAHIPRPQLAAAVATVDLLARAPDDNYHDILRGRYSQVRQFLPALLRTISFEGTQAARPVLKAVHFLRDIESCRRPDMTSAPQEMVGRSWRRLVFPTEGKVEDGQPPVAKANRCFYTFCVLERLQDALHRRDIYVAPSERWGNPRAKLLQGTAWESMRGQVCRTLGRSLSAEEELNALSHQLDAAYRRTAQNLPANRAIRIEAGKKGDTFSLAHLDKLEDPPSLTRLQQRVEAMLPRVDLTDAVLEIHGCTDFADAFTHVSEGNARVEDLPLSICAVLIAEACNIGLEPLIRPEVPALTRDRLSWVQQNYLRAETIARANARLVDAQAHIPLARAWGGGEVASADGLRFVVPVRTINAGPNSKYFPAQRGVTYYNFTSDQFTGLHGIIIPGTTHEAPYLLEVLLEQQTFLKPMEVMTDTAAYSDLIFGLFWLLGYQFSPRLADVGETRFWRIDPGADYGPLNGLARNRIRTEWITKNWEDMLRVAGSLKVGTVSASELVRSFQGTNKLSGLARSIGELGRVAKTLYLLDYIHDENYRRRILIQLNRHENRHRMARVLFHGQRGELRQRYREGQEDQLGALGLILNVIILWNTRYMDAALNYLRAQGEEIRPEDVARLSPLRYAHMNFLGRYLFNLDAATLRGELRPFHLPDLKERLLW